MRMKWMGMVLVTTLVIVGCGRERESEPIPLMEESPVTYSDRLIEPKVEESTVEVAKEPFVMDETQFMKQLNNIFYYLESYQDRDIVVEGYFGYPHVHLQEEGIAADEHMSHDGDAPAVYRNSPGCCGHDGWAGFLLDYQGEYPEEGAWIKVIGKPDVVRNEQGGFSLSLSVSSIEVLETKGLDFVTQ